jgi:hypothetical protein
MRGCCCRLVLSDGKSIQVGSLWFGLVPGLTTHTRPLVLVRSEGTSSHGSLVASTPRIGRLGVGAGYTWR